MIIRRFVRRSGVLIPAIFVSLMIAIFSSVRFSGWARATPGGQVTGTSNPLKIPYQTLDPQLGYSHIPEFVSYGEANSAHTIRILTLGGSTTDPFTEDDLGAGAKLALNNWPQELENLLAKDHVRAVVFNLGVGGYSSNQEALKLIRDGLQFRPNIILSLEGVNDMGFIWSSSPEYPMVNPYQIQIMRFLESSIPGMKVSLGIKARGDITPEEQWERNIRIMRAVSAEFGASYLCFLQPIMGFGDYSASPVDKEMMKEQMQTPATQGELRLVPGVHAKGYMQALGDFYHTSQERCKRMPYCVDLTNAFKGKSNMYHDPRHPNPEGYRVIAKAIFKELEIRGLLEPTNTSEVHFPEEDRTASRSGVLAWSLSCYPSQAPKCRELGHALIETDCDRYPSAFDDLSNVWQYGIYARRSDECYDRV